MYESLISDMEIIQGDSSDIFTFGESTGAVLDANWTASFSILSDYGTSPIVNRTLPKDAGLTNFIFQIYPSESAILTPNTKYIVGVQIINTSLNYNAEVAQFKLKVLNQVVI